MQMYHFLLSYFKTKSNGSARVELTTSRAAARCSTNIATGVRLPVVVSYLAIDKTN